MVAAQTVNSVFLVLPNANVLAGQCRWFRDLTFGRLDLCAMELLGHDFPAFRHPGKKHHALGECQRCDTSVVECGLEL